jgi:HSP20 family protein
MRNTHNNLWAEAFAMLEQADRLHRQFFRWAGGDIEPIWEPPVDVSESREGVEIVVALPGVDADRIEVNLEGQLVTVRAWRPVVRPARAGAIRRLEIPYGRFERRLALAEAVYELGECQLRNGCLHIALNRRGEMT